MFESVRDEVEREIRHREFVRHETAKKKLGEVLAGMLAALDDPGQLTRDFGAASRVAQAERKAAAEAGPVSQADRDARVLGALGGRVEPQPAGGRGDRNGPVRVALGELRPPAEPAPPGGDRTEQMQSMLDQMQGSN